MKFIISVASNAFVFIIVISIMLVFIFCASTTSSINLSTSANTNNNTNSSNEVVNAGNDFILPLSQGVVTCDYACYAGHKGIDFDYADNIPILAVGTGTVLIAKSGCISYPSSPNACNGGYGNYVLIKHVTSDDIFFSLYAHLSSIIVNEGDIVSQADSIGLLGNSGNSYGSHLHFEFYLDKNQNGIPDDAKTNPRSYLSIPSTGVWW